MTADLWVVWLDEAARVASFHPTEGSREQRFRSHEHFLNFLQELQAQGYRFQ